MIGENRPWAYAKPYDVEIRMTKIGPRTVRIDEDMRVFGVEIEKGYETDGASVPRWLWWIISPFTEAFRPALAHDKRHGPGMTWKERKFADDKFFWDLMREEINIVRSGLSWLGVRAYAWSLRPFGKWK